jgi:hypothetical protein
MLSELKHIGYQVVKNMLYEENIKQNYIDFKLLKEENSEGIYSKHEHEIDEAKRLLPNSTSRGDRVEIEPPMKKRAQVCRDVIMHHHNKKFGWNRNTRLRRVFSKTDDRYNGIYAKTKTGKWRNIEKVWCIILERADLPIEDKWADIKIYSELRDASNPYYRNTRNMVTYMEKEIYDRETLEIFYDYEAVELVIEDINLNDAGNIEHQLGFFCSVLAGYPFQII